MATQFVNSSRNLLARFLDDMFQAGAKQSTPGAFERLADAILEGAVACDYDTVNSELLDRAESEPVPENLQRSSTEPPRNLVLKSAVVAWCELRWPKAGGFVPEKPGDAGVADLLSRDGRIWVECGTSNPEKVLDVLSNDDHDLFVHAEDCLAKREEVRIWIYSRNQLRFRRWFNNYKKRLNLELRKLGTKQRVPAGRYPLRTCAVPGCGKQFLPRTHNQRACGPAHSEELKRPALARKTRPMPADVAAKVLDLVESSGDLAWSAFFGLAFETGLSKGTLLELRLSHVFDGNRVRNQLVCNSRRGPNCSRPLKASLPALRRLIEARKGKGKPANAEDWLFPFHGSPSQVNVKLNEILKNAGLVGSKFTVESIRTGVIVRTLRTASDNRSTRFEMRDLVRSFGLSGNAEDRYLSQAESGFPVR